MRYNNFQNNPLSDCNCRPRYTAEYAIAARNDLNDPNGTYPFEALSFRDWGAIDTKVTNLEMSKNFEMLVVSSPTYDQQEPFEWSTTRLPKSIRHEGHPDNWAFPPYYLKWYPIENELVGADIVEDSFR